VIAAALPLYPVPARIAQLQGTVTLTVWTDGQRVSTVKHQSGSPILSEAAEASVKTWQFKPHEPTSFPVMFRYRLEPPYIPVESSDAFDDNPTILLRLPSEVEITAAKKGIVLVDPRVKRR
jgi:TonB family protein